MDSFEKNNLLKNTEGEGRPEVSAARVLAELHAGVPTLNLRNFKDQVDALEQSGEVPGVPLEQLKGIFYEVSTRVVRRVWGEAEAWIQQNLPGIGYTQYSSSKRAGSLVSYASSPEKFANLRNKVFSANSLSGAKNVLSPITSKTFGFFAKSWSAKMKNRSGFSGDLTRLDVQDRQEILDYRLYSRILAMQTDLNLPSPADNSWPVEDLQTGFETQNNLEWQMYEMVPELYRVTFPGRELKFENLSRMCDASIGVISMLARLHQDFSPPVTSYLTTTAGSISPRLDLKKFELIGDPENCQVQIKGRPLGEYVHSFGLPGNATAEIPRIGCPAHLSRNPHTKDSVIQEVHKKWLMKVAKSLFFPYVIEKYPYNKQT